MPTAGEQASSLESSAELVYPEEKKRAFDQMRLAGEGWLLGKNARNRFGPVGAAALSAIPLAYEAVKAGAMSKEELIAAPSQRLLRLGGVLAAPLMYPGWEKESIRQRYLNLSPSDLARAWPDKQDELNDLYMIDPSTAQPSLTRPAAWLRGAFGLSNPNQAEALER